MTTRPQETSRDDLIERTARCLDELADACFAALGPASRWGGEARGNAEAVRRFGVRENDGWTRNRASDWREFAAKTDPDLTVLALKASDALADLARSADVLGTLFLDRRWSIPYHAGSTL